MPEELKSRLISFAEHEGKKDTIKELAIRFQVSESSVIRMLRSHGLYPRKKKSVRAKASVPQHTSTLAAVAEKAGVSRSTASLALKGSGKVSNLTAERVQKCAQELGYTLHPYVSALMKSVRSGRVQPVTESLGYVYATVDAKNRFAEEYPKLYGPARRFDGAQARARKLGFELKPFDLFEFGDNIKRQQEVMFSQGINGVLFDTPSYTLGEVGFPLDPFACVTFRDSAPLNVHCVQTDYFSDVEKAYSTLWSLGFRRIGYLFSYGQAMASNDARVAGFREAQFMLSEETDKIPPFPFLVFSYHLIAYCCGQPELIQDMYQAGESKWFHEQDWSSLSAKQVQDIQNDSGDTGILAVLEKWIRYWKPEAIITEDARMIEWLETLNIHVPAQLSVAHLDLKEDTPGWAGIRRADEQVGQEAIQLLCDQLALGRKGAVSVPLHQRIRGHWQNGDTVRAGRQVDLPQLTDVAKKWLRQSIGDDVGVHP